MSGDTLSRIRARGPIGIRLGLERMRALLSRLGDPQASLQGVLIAGTNGKGSVAAMVASMLRAEGCRTSQAPSPHLSSYRERIVIDGRPISRDDLEHLLEEVLRASEPGEATHGPATEFELLMAGAFLWSARCHVEVAVIEVGLGGRLDATNTWDAQVATITNVGLDHQVLLGDTVELVAAEKAAIIKPGSHAVTGATGPALDVIAGHARARGVPLTTCAPLVVEQHDVTGLSLRHHRLGRLHVALLGRHQAGNAAVALGTIDALRSTGIASVGDEGIRRGLSQVRWPGRMELIELEGVTLLLDGAHNPDGASALAETVDGLASSLPAGRATLVLAILADKEVATIVERLGRSRVLASAHLLATRVPDSDRSLPASELAQAWRTDAGHEPSGRTIEVVDDVDEALRRGLRRAALEGGPLIVSGSLYLVGHVRARSLPNVDPS